MLARSLAAAALTCAAAAAGAQTPAQPPLDRAGGPPAAYRSAYEGYRPYVEEPLAPWREVNDTVERVGGHAGVLRDEARTPPPPSAPPATLPATAPKGAGHDAHHRK